MVNVLYEIHPKRYELPTISLAELQRAMKKVGRRLEQAREKAPAAARKRLGRYATYAAWVEAYLESKIGVREAEAAVLAGKGKEALAWVARARGADKRALALSARSKRTGDGVVDITYFPQWYDRAPESGQYDRKTGYAQLEYRARRVEG